MLQGLVYLSAADPMLVEDDIRDILGAANNNNMTNSITGLLLYSGSSFLQVLEGEGAAVRETMARIKQDKRHKDIVVMTHEPIKNRSFSDWSMAFREIDADTLTRLYNQLEWHDEQAARQKSQRQGAGSLIGTIRDLVGDLNDNAPGLVR